MRHRSALGPAGMVLGLLVATAVTFVGAAPAAAAGPGDVLGVSVRLNSFEAPTPTAPTHAAHPGLAMISAMATWASLEPVEGTFDWSVLDADVEDARTGGYRIVLRIMTGRLSPSWLADEGVATIDVLGTDISSVDYCEHLRTPLPWDPILRAKYTDLMTEVARWLNEPDGAGRTKGDHVFAIPIAMPSFQGTEMNLGYGANVTCPAGTDGAGTNLAGANQAAWDAVSTVAERRAWTEQAWVDAIDIHMATLPEGVDSLLAYGALFGDQQVAAIRLAETQVPRYPDRLWSMYTNLQPKVRADGSLGSYREWCAACWEVMMRVTAEHGLLGFQTAGIRVNDTSAKFHAAVEDGLATYGMRFLETQPDNVADYEGYLVSAPGNVQSRILATDHERATVATVTCGAVTIGGSATCTATVTDAGAGPITPGGSMTVGWSASSGSFETGRCTPSGVGAAASCSVTYTPAGVGTADVTATWDGDSNHLGSEGTATISVGARPTSTLVSCPASVRINEPAACTVSVTDTGTGARTDPSGDVSWTSGTAGSFDAVACALQPSGGGAASCGVVYTPAAPGSHVLAASYAGDTVHGSSGAGATVTARLRTTSTTVMCGTPVQVGVASTCTATATDTDGGSATSPVGTVSWSSGASGTFSAATCALAATGATTSACSVTYTPAATGTHSLSGSYGGDASHAAASGGVTVTASKRSTATSVTCGTPVVAGTSTTCTATVTDTSSGTATTPGGASSVSWSSSGAGSFGPATCTPAGTGATASCSVAYTPTTSGARTVTAAYAGDSLHTGGSSAPFTVTATAPPDTTGPAVTITAPSGTTVPKNKAFVITATATDPSGVASVAFSVGSTLLCTDVTSPYSCSWKVPAKANVNYTITVTGRDTSGNLTTVTKTVRAV